MKKFFFIFLINLLYSLSYGQTIKENGDGNFTIIGLSSSDEVEYFGKIDSLNYYLITSSSIYIGKSKLRKQKWNGIMIRALDGGSTWYHFENGTFYFPVDLFSDIRPPATFNGKIIKKIDLRYLKVSKKN